MDRIGGTTFGQKWYIFRRRKIEKTGQSEIFGEASAENFEMYW